MMATMTSKGNESEEEYPDKSQVQLCKDPARLKMYFKEHPEDLYDAERHLKTMLENTKETSNDIITVELHIEERTLSRDPVDFRCSPNWTVYSAKMKIEEIFSLNKDHLCVLYRRAVAKDWMRLKDCGIEENGDVLYVYVFVPIKAKPRGPTNKRPGSSQIGINSEKNLPIQPEDLRLSNPSINNENAFPEQAPMPAGPVGGNYDFAAAFMTPDPAELASMGQLWTCNNCTFLNESWRQECNMCNAPMPNNTNSPEKIMQQTVPEIPVENIEMGSVELKLNRLEDEKPQEPGWRCPQCTFFNQPTRPGCEMCSTQRPEDYRIPDGYILSRTEQERIDRDLKLEEEAQEKLALERRENYEKHVSVVDRSIITSVEPVECLICFTEADPQDTIVLRECLHRFCKDCMKQHIINCDEAAVSCPYADDDYKCNYSVTQREIKALLNEEEFQKYLERGLALAEKASPNSFHCKTPDCKGWCEYDDQVNIFHCPVCEKKNCLTCKAIHEKLDCKQYQDEMELKAATDKEALETRKLLESMVKKGEAMHCPQCNIIIQKKVGCDWIRCPMCKLEICWVTKGPRWGPKGRGDSSGGCHCRENNKKCHKDCNNCH